MQQLASLPGASQGPASTLSKAHPPPTQAWGGAALTHEVWRLLVAAEEGSHTGKPVGVAVPAYKGCLPVNLHKPSHLQLRRGCAGPAQHRAHTRPEPPAGLRAGCQGPLAQNACSSMPAQRSEYRQSCATNTWHMPCWQQEGLRRPGIGGDLGMHGHAKRHAHTVLKVCSAANLQSQLCSDLAMLRPGTLPAHRVLQVCSSSR